MVEVPPAELPGEFLTARFALDPGEQRRRGEAAEVEVGAEPRGRFCREVVVALLVAGEGTADPKLQAPSRGGLASLLDAGGG